MAQQITRWICHKEGGKKEKDNWERGESRVIVPKSGSVALCPCFRNHFQPKRGIHGSLQGQDGLGANWSSQRYEKGSGWKKMVLRSVPTHPIPWSSKSEYSFCFTNASSSRPPISPAPLGWEHPGLAEAWPELVEVVFVLPSQDIIYKHHSYPHIKIRAQDWGLSGSGLMWFPWISVNLLIITSSRFSFTPWSLMLFLDSLVYQQSFTSVLFLFPLPIPALSSWFRTVM